MASQINRIEKEFIFKNMQKQLVELSLHGYHLELTCLLKDFTEERLTLKLLEKTKKSLQREQGLQFFFAFQNNYYTFETKVISHTAEILIVENPRFIYRDPQRKYVRLKLTGLKVFFLLEGEKVELEFPKTETFVLTGKPEYADDFNPESIVKLINTFRTYVKDKVTEHRIVMYRDKSPQSLEERLLIKTAKAFWIPSTEEDLPLHDPDFLGNIIVKKEVEDFLMSSGTPKYLVRSEIAHLLDKKAKSNVFSEIYCPILYQEYAVGFIYLINRKPRNEKLSSELLKYVLQFSRVLSYSLEINGYYRQHRKADVQHQALVIDISAAGLLFATSEETVYKKINLYNDLDLNIFLEERRVVFSSRIMRKLQDNKNYYFGAQFMKASDDDFHYLFEFLYGKPYTTEAANLWEGGTPPPAERQG